MVLGVWWGVERGEVKFRIEGICPAQHSQIYGPLRYQNLVRFMFSSPLWILPKSLKSADGKSSGAYQRAAKIEWRQHRR